MNVKLKKFNFNFNFYFNYLNHLAKLHLNNANENDWIIGNIQHSGFYRVNYDLDNWNKLAKQLLDNNQLIHPINRAQLIDDAFNLGRAELLSQTVFLNIIKYLQNETDGLPFEAALDGLYFIHKMLADSYTAQNLFKVFYKRSYL